MNQDLERELRMLGIMIPTEDEVEVEEDTRALHLSKDWYNDPRDENGEVTF
tara:strand:+ start:321 stop:473 length:153 start_codon:yes stop_codon:yes gene_type:complete